MEIEEYEIERWAEGFNDIRKTFPSVTPISPSGFTMPQTIGTININAKNTKPSTTKILNKYVKVFSIIKNPSSWTNHT